MKTSTILRKTRQFSQINFVLLFVIALTIFGNKVKAQNNIFAVFIGDTVELSLSSANGTIQWQQADDTMSVWNNIAGANTNPFTHITENSGTGNKYYRAQITNSAICQAPWFSSIIKHKIISDLTELQIGDFYAGGIVFFNDNGKGLIAAPTDQGTSTPWNNLTLTTVGLTSTIIGSGKSNTDYIVAHQGVGNYAARLCYDLVLNGYDDWFLPSKDELSQLYSINSTFNIVSKNFYWSSSEANESDAWTQYFLPPSMSPNTMSKFTTYYVRAIRAFGNPPLSVQERLATETPKQIFDSGIPIDSLYGKTYQGGLIFSFNPVDGTGLVAAPTDEDSIYQWGCNAQLMTGADGLIIGTGNQNTIDIETECLTANTAADVCANLVLDSYSDWFLPSKDELYAIYTNLKLNGLGNLTTSEYWSSSEFGLSTAWLVGFASGSQYSYDKGNTFKVRAVRAF
jgi:hypothetical protein